MPLNGGRSARSRRDEEDKGTNCRAPPRHTCFSYEGKGIRMSCTVCVKGPTFLRRHCPQARVELFRLALRAELEEVVLRPEFSGRC